MNKLPVVKSDVCFSLERNLVNISDKKYLTEQIQKIEKENPIIAEFIKRFSNKTKDKVNAMFGCIMTYNLLESQVEANNLREMFS